MAESNPNVAALIAQMPDTDQQKRNPNDAKAVNSASKFTGPEPAEAEKVFAAILSGGKESVLQLLGAVHDPGDGAFKDYKAGYVLHGLCLYTGHPGREEQRRMLAEAIASQLKGGAHSTAAKRILIRELQAAGGKDSVAALGECLGDAELCDSAVQALVAIREDAAAPLRKALGAVNGRNLAAVLQALGELQDKESVPALRKFLTHDETDLRRSAAVALTKHGDVQSIEALLKFAAESSGWDRSHATGLCFVMAEKLAATEQKSQAAKIYTRLRDDWKDPDERHIGEAATNALEALKL
jgi:HEAT repeat protein